MDERRAERADLLGQVGMVGDHHHHRHVEIATAVAPQQIQQAMVLLEAMTATRLGLAASVSRKSISNVLGHLLGEVVGQRVARSRQTRQVKDGALHEHSTSLLGRMLVQRDDVGACRVRNVLTAATSPGRSAQRSNSRPMSLTGNGPRPARANFRRWRTRRLR